VRTFTVSSSAHLLVLRHLWVIRRRRPWQLIVNGVFEPFLYLMSIGVGVGQLIGNLTGAGPEGTAYAAFVAPALLATSAMNSAVNETTGSIWWRLRFEKVYDAIITTPLTITDIAVGEVAASMLRGALASTCFLAVIAALGLVHSWWALLAVPAALLIAYAFSGAGLAVTTYLREFHHHQYVQLFMLPMFLFATTFYPLSIYPRPLQVVVACLPLYQSTELLRGLALGQPGANLLWAVAYLLAMGTVGMWIARQRLGRLLMH
jgi:lipooligosaccharide transport system permease protein